MTVLPVTISTIGQAAAAINGAIARTPVIPAPAISELVGAEIHLKLETLHRTGSFKERGALAKLLTLDASARRAGVVAMSAGNHAQGVAYHAQRLGIPATIVMPEGTPFIKIDRTEVFGAKVVLQGDNLSAAREAADRIARDQGLVLVHPYDDPAVIAGQGTIAPERFRGRRVGIVICGGNIDARLLASILMRGLVREGRLVRLRSELPDMPGALSRLSAVVGKHAGNIVEVHHQRLFHDTSVKRAELDVVVETQNRRHVEVLIAALAEAGFPTQLLSSNGADERADCNAAHEDATRVGGRP